MTNVTTGANAQDILLIYMGNVLKGKTRMKRYGERSSKKKVFHYRGGKVFFLGAKKDRVLN